MSQPILFSRVNFGIVGRSRGTGRAGSARAASAYNMCARMGEFDYRRKAAEHCGHAVLLPPGAPAKFSDPAKLWTAAEAMENRRDAQLARQILISIPREIPAERRLDFIKSVVAPYVATGMATQIDIHAGPATEAADGREQPHAHILMSLRPLGPAGFAAKKERSWNLQFTESDGRAEKRRIQDRMNGWLAAAGIKGRIDLSKRAEFPEPDAPKDEWQRWKRQGRPDAADAPPSVAAVLQHRADKVELTSMYDVIRRAGEWIDHDTAALSRINIQQAQEATTMTRTNSEQTRPRTAPEWATKSGGYDRLPAALKVDAKAAYEKWKAGPGANVDHSMYEYVDFVQSKKREERRRQAEAAGQDTRPQPRRRPRNGVSGSGLHDLKNMEPTRELLAKLPGWRADKAGDDVRLYPPPPAGGFLIDEGDTLWVEDNIDPALLVEAAVAKGWKSMEIHGDDDFKRSVALAAALHEPPLPIDYDLSVKDQNDVDKQIKQRNEQRAKAEAEAAKKAAEAEKTRIFAACRENEALAGGDPSKLEAARKLTLAVMRENPEAIEKVKAAIEAQGRGETPSLIVPPEPRRDAVAAAFKPAAPEDDRRMRPN